MEYSYNICEVNVMMPFIEFLFYVLLLTLIGLTFIRIWNYSERKQARDQLEDNIKFIKKQVKEIRKIQDNLEETKNE